MKDLPQWFLDLPITFDSERNYTKPCFDCGTTVVPRTLVDIGYDESRQDEITRPLCPACKQKRERESP